VINRQKRVRVAVAPLEQFLRKVKREIGIAGAEVTVCLVSDAHMAQLNEAYRGKSGSTDVLSFPAENRKKPMAIRRAARGANVALGDVAIAPETARRYARRNGRALGTELRVLMLHGVLHLMGYDHETDRGEMDRAEQRLRRRLGVA